MKLLSADDMREWLIRKPITPEELKEALTIKDCIEASPEEAEAIEIMFTKSDSSRW